MPGTMEGAGDMLFIRQVDRKKKPNLMSSVTSYREESTKCKGNTGDRCITALEGNRMLP